MTSILYGYWIYLIFTNSNYSFVSSIVAAVSLIQHFNFMKCANDLRERRGRDRKAVGFTSTC